MPITPSQRAALNDFSNKVAELNPQTQHSILTGQDTSIKLGEILYLLGGYGHVVTISLSNNTATIDWNASVSQFLDASQANGPITLTLTNPVAGSTYMLEISQGASVNAINFSPSVNFLANSGILQIANSNSVIELYFDGTTYYEIGRFNNKAAMISANPGADTLFLQKTCGGF